MNILSASFPLLLSQPSKYYKMETNKTNIITWQSVMLIKVLKGTSVVTMNWKPWQRRPAWLPIQITDYVMFFEIIKENYLTLYYAFLKAKDSERMLRFSIHCFTAIDGHF